MSALAIVLAAGKSTRMKSAIPKVLHEVCGRPMIDYVLDAARASGVDRIVAVVGHRADLVEESLRRHSDVSCVLQSEQKGTGHAIMMCREELERHVGSVLVLAGDTPLLRADSLQKLLACRETEQAAAVIGTAVTPANQGLGRIVRDEQGHFQRIVEEKDASSIEKSIQEINTGCYAFDAQQLLSSLDQIRPDNSQAEYYLTDCPRVLLHAGRRVAALNAFEIVEALGVNTRVQLAEVAASIQHANALRLMTSGVTIVQPSATVIDPRAVIGIDTVIEPFVTIRGKAHIGDNCRIGSYALIEDGVVVEQGTSVPPYAHLRR